MADTPRPMPTVNESTRRHGGWSWAKLDPDGYVTATWRTWGLLALAIFFCTKTYMKLDDAAEKVNALAVEVQVHREILIKAGLLTVQNSGTTKATP